MVGHKEGVNLLRHRRTLPRSEEFYREMARAGVLPNMVMVFGHMNEPTGPRFRVGHAALPTAEYSRHDEHRDLLRRKAKQRHRGENGAHR
jgi:F-type H+-transporting ATPase subunit beta